MGHRQPRVRDLLHRGADMLRAAGMDTPELDASLILAHALQMDRAALYARTDEEIAPDVQAAFDTGIARRAAYVPIAYITGTKEFYGLRFATTPEVLVPRPETELLVAWAIEWLRGHAGRRVYDVGTGSGAIAVTVAHEVPAARVVGSDISREALRVARANAHIHRVEDRIAFVRGDLLSWCGQGADVILANLPYLTDAEASAASVAAEPLAALVGGDEDGFACNRGLIPEALRLLAPGGAFAFEIGAHQAAVAVGTVRVAVPDAIVAVHADLAGLPRYVTVETAQVDRDTRA